MPQRHRVYQVTAPANTPASAPLEVPTPLDPGIVRRIVLHIRQGHASLTGIQLAVAHQQIIPENTGAFILGNGDVHTFDVEEMPDSGAWSAIVYNTDPTYAHYWQVSYYYDPLPRRRRTTRTRTPLTADAIHKAGAKHAR